MVMATLRLLLLQRRGIWYLSSSFSSSSSSPSSSERGEAAQQQVQVQVPVKQVTASNFDEAVEALRPLLEQAAFIALDTEMTGLCSTPWRDSFEWDSTAVRFLKLRHSASHFGLLQLGICPFLTSSSHANTLVAYPHTFHLRPSSSFLCQPSSLLFLSSHCFDFNASLLHGILDPRPLISLLSSPHPHLLVGHNCILDIAHLFHKFVSPIPPSLPSFVRQVHRSFPHLIDTKHLLFAHPSIRHLMQKKSKSLSSAFSSLCPPTSIFISSPSPLSTSPQHQLHIQVHPHHQASSFNSGAKHEAGYDAFMTGCVFAQLCTHVGIPSHHPSHPLQSNPKLQPYLNHLYPTWNSGTVLDFATATEKPENEAYRPKYPKVVFQNILLLWGFPSTLNFRTLKGCIAKAFGQDSVVSLFFIDSTAVLVQFKKEEHVKEFLVLKESLERRKYDPISMLHPLSVIFQGSNTKAGDYNTYRDVIACNLSKVMFKDQADASGVTCKVGHV